jgi:hypothetical protein
LLPTNQVQTHRRPDSTHKIMPLRRTDKSTAGFVEGDQLAGPAELRAHRGLLGRAT